MVTTGFWSYVQSDDGAESGRIKALAEDLAAQYEAITTERVEIFLDRSSLGWGDDWDAKIEEAVVATSFFIPVVSPRYLTSDACRREMRLFVQKASGLGLADLIMPLVWFDVPQLSESNPTDDLVRIIKKYQWVDWRSLRFEERTSGAYRHAVHELAQRLVDVTSRLANATAAPLTLAEDSSTDDKGDGGPGELDLIATAEEAMPAWTENLGKIQEEIVEIGSITEAATVELNATTSKSRPFAARLSVVRKYKQDLDPHAQLIEELGNEFTTRLYEVDGGVRTILLKANTSELDSSEAAEYARFSRSVKALADGSQQGLGALQSLVDTIQPIESMSRDLRPTLVKLRRGLTVMVEGQKVIDEWAKLADDDRATGTA